MRPVFTLADWRSSPERVTWLKEQFNNNLFRDLFDVLRNSALDVSNPNKDVSGDFFHGMQYGKTTMLNVLLMCAEDPVKQEDVPVTYGVDDRDEHKGV